MGARVLDRDPPRPAAGSGGGGGGGWAWLLTAGGLIEAELVRGVLAAAGVDPVVLDRRDASPSAWLFPSGNVNAPVRVLVPRVLLETARLALLEAAEPGGDEDPTPAVPASAGRRTLTFITAALTLLAIVLIVFLTARASATCVLRIAC